MNRILAIDYGLKRIGIAVTDPLQIIASALITVENKEIYKFLDDYFLKEKVEEIVVGLPKQLNNEDAEIMEYVEKFSQKLKNKYPNILISSYDERFTSKIAAYSMVQAGFKKKDRQKKENLDKISASILLQSYLEYKKNKI